MTCVVTREEATTALEILVHAHELTIETLRRRNKALDAELSILRVELANQKTSKKFAYSERNRLVAALSKCFPGRRMRHHDDDVDWEDDWRWVVCLDLPTGQVSWHIHDEELHWFDHLPIKPNNWDCHSTAVKLDRLAELPYCPYKGA